MGYHNANLVAVWHGGLPGASFKVLIRMALSSRDSDAPPRYHGGPGPLLLALGRREVEPGDDSEAARVAREADEKALQRAVQPLRAAGLVSYAVAPVRGKAPEYWLHLEPSKAVGGAVDNHPQGDAKGDGKCPPRGTESVPPNASKGDGFRPGRGTESVPPEKKEQKKDLDEDQTNSSQVSTSPARSDSKIVNPVGLSDHGCIRGWTTTPSGERSTDRCPTCRPAHLKPVPAITPEAS